MAINLVMIVRHPETGKRVSVSGTHPWNPCAAWAMLANEATRVLGTHQFIIEHSELPPDVASIATARNYHLARAREAFACYYETRDNQALSWAAHEIRAAERLLDLNNRRALDPPGARDADPDDAGPDARRPRNAPPQAPTRLSAPGHRRFTPGVRTVLRSCVTVLIGQTGRDGASERGRGDTSTALPPPSTFHGRASW